MGVAIGLEIHVQLATRSKLFCGCRADYFGAPPNSLTCPVCLAHPGTLPVLNRRAVELALRVAVALGAAIPPISAFDRKNYFYPDLPKGYQITQQERPWRVGAASPSWFPKARRPCALPGFTLRKMQGNASMRKSIR